MRMTLTAGVARAMDSPAAIRRSVNASAEFTSEPIAAQTVAVHTPATRTDSIGPIACTTRAAGADATAATHQYSANAMPSAAWLNAKSRRICFTAVPAMKDGSAHVASTTIARATSPGPVVSELASAPFTRRTYETSSS